jgi:hypothetical protein
LNGKQQEKANYSRAVATFCRLEPSRWRPDSRSSYGSQDLERLVTRLITLLFALVSSGFVKSHSASAKHTRSQKANSKAPAVRRLWGVMSNLRDRSGDVKPDRFYALRFCFGDGRYILVCLMSDARRSAPP